MSSNHLPPDLSAILRTLAQHSGHPVPAPSPSGPQQQPQHQRISSATVSQRLQRSEATGPAPVDPSRITTYPAALRYTSTLLASDTALTARIKKLIRSQHEHERMWWAGRGGVLAERVKRIEGRRAVNDVLRSLGGKVAESGGQDVGSEEEALAEFDRKVYAASLEMEKDYRRQLKEMGIPGFVVRGELVGDGVGKVSRVQIRELEGRMVGLLEDLCKD